MTKQLGPDEYFEPDTWLGLPESVLHFLIEEAIISYADAVAGGTAERDARASVVDFTHGWVKEFAKQDMVTSTPEHDLLLLFATGATVHLLIRQPHLPNVPRDHFADDLLVLAREAIGAQSYGFLENCVARMRERMHAPVQPMTPAA